MQSMISGDQLLGNPKRRRCVCVVPSCASYCIDVFVCRSTINRHRGTSHKNGMTCRTILLLLLLTTLQSLFRSKAMLVAKSVHRHRRNRVKVRNGDWRRLKDGRWSSGFGNSCIHSSGFVTAAMGSLGGSRRKLEPFILPAQSNLF